MGNPCLIAVAWMSGHITMGWLKPGSLSFHAMHTVVTPDTLFHVCSNEAFVTVTAHNGYTYIFTLDGTNGPISTKSFSFNSSLVLGDEAVKLCSSGALQFRIILVLQFIRVNYSRLHSN